MLLEVQFLLPRPSFSAIMEQPGVLVSLSRKRSRVQIPLVAPSLCVNDSLPRVICLWTSRGAGNAQHTRFCYWFASVTQSLCRELGKFGCSRSPRAREITGSNPVFPTKFCSVLCGVFIAVRHTSCHRVC